MYDDYLLFGFKINEKNEKNLISKKIYMNNTIYSLNREYKISSIVISNIYYLANEVLLSKKNNHIKTYYYNILSNLIKIGDNNYTFPIIDDNEVVRYKPFELSYTKGNNDFNIRLEKRKNYLNIIEVKYDSFKEIFFWSFGTIAIVIEIIIPLFYCLYQKARLCSRKIFKSNSISNSNDINLDNLPRNETSPQNQINELQDIKI